MLHKTEVLAEYGIGEMQQKNSRVPGKTTGKDCFLSGKLPESVKICILTNNYKTTMMREKGQRRL